MTTLKTPIALLLMLGLSHFVQAEDVALFTQVSYSESDNSPPPEDSLVVYDSALNVTGLADMPSFISVRIPGQRGDGIAVRLRLERMDRREGFGERDPKACDSGDASGCEIVPYPDLPPEQFSYTIKANGDTFDLRLTIHKGYAIGVIVGPHVRYGIQWNMLKEFRPDYFLIDDSIGNGADEAAQGASAAPTFISEQQAAASSLARIEPASAPSSVAQLDMLVLLTEEARLEAGGDPLDCRDITGAMSYIYQAVADVNTTFINSLVDARVGVVTVARLNGYSYLVGNPLANRSAIQANANIKAFRNAVGADVVSVLFDDQANFGACGVAYGQRPGCTYSPPTAGCGVGPLFSEYSYSLSTVQCSTSADAFTHEIGHNLGADHDIAHTGIPPGAQAYPYAFGWGHNSNVNGFETVMSQRLDPLRYPVRLLQFSNPSVSYLGNATGAVGTADNALVVSNLVSGAAALRSRPQVIFANGFDDIVACPGVNF